MKKSLIALAVVGAFTSSAFAEGSNVQLYGIIDLGVAHFSGLAPMVNNVNSANVPVTYPDKTGKNGTVSSTSMNSGGQSSSRIGLKGSEDLGGGLKAIFQAETGFCAAGTNQNGVDTSGYCSGSGFMQRTSIVGLTGGFGTVVAGRMNTPLWNDEIAADPFGAGLTGNIDNISNVASAGVQRANQTVAYVSPDLMGFTGTAVYSFAPTSVPVNLQQGGNTSRAWELNGAYNNGPVFASLDYLRVTNFAIANEQSLALPNTLNTNSPIDNNVAPSDSTLYPNSSGSNGGNAVKHWQVTGGYDFGIAKVTGLYQNLTVDGNKGVRAVWMLGATVPVGAGAVLASYGQVHDSISNPYTGSNTAKQYAIGYTYSLSKRTNLYTSYSHISNDNNTALAVGDASTANPGVDGQSSNGFDLGIRHKF